MNTLLEKAFKAASKLPSAAQDALGARILRSLEDAADEVAWDAAFEATQDDLERIAGDALAELAAGSTTPLDFGTSKK